MRKYIGLIACSLMMVLGVALGANAQTNRNINARERNQQKRIARGVENGSLTPAEAARLERDEAEVRRLEARLRDSGNHLNPRERSKLERKLNDLNRKIYKEKHDREGRRP